MHYLLLLAADEALDPQPGTPEFDVEMARYAELDERFGASTITGAALWPAATATTVRPGTDGPLVTEGPFAESVEVAGGVFVVELDDLDAAIDYAQSIPAAGYGAVEIRPFAAWNSGPSEPMPGTDDRPRSVAFIWRDESNAPVPGDPAFQEAMAGHARFGIERSAVIEGGGGLQLASTATTVRVRGDEVLVTDGPFAETTEVIGGLYFLGPLSPAEAISVASEIPAPPTGGVELRSVMELG